jgi:hypothetical protein
MDKTESCPRCGARKQTLCNRPYRVYVQGHPVEIESVEVLECAQCGCRKLTPSGEQTLVYFYRSRGADGETLH